MMCNTPLLRDRIRAGAIWLDDNQPGWRDNVIIPDLDLSSVCRCVLGQVFTPLVAAELSRPDHDSALDEMNQPGWVERIDLEYGYLNGFSYATGDGWEGNVIGTEESQLMAFDVPLHEYDNETDDWIPPAYEYTDMTREWRAFLKGEWT
jgi:hypothetical protein